MVDFPGISSASSKFLCSSVWQKYCDRKSSGRQTICAPCFAASRMKLHCAHKIFLRLRAAPHLDERDLCFVQRLALRQCASVIRECKVLITVSCLRKFYFTELAGTMSIFSIITRFVGLLISPPLPKVTGVLPIFSRTSSPLISLPKVVY